MRKHISMEVISTSAWTLRRHEYLSRLEDNTSLIAIAEDFIDSIIKKFISDKRYDLISFYKSDCFHYHYSDDVLFIWYSSRTLSLHLYFRFMEDILLSVDQHIPDSSYVIYRKSSPTLMAYNCNPYEKDRGKEQIINVETAINYCAILLENDSNKCKLDEDKTLFEYFHPEYIMPTTFNPYPYPQRLSGINELFCKKHDAIVNDVKFIPMENEKEEGENEMIKMNFKNGTEMEITVKNDFAIKNVIFNYPATIVFWEDGTKTVVKAQGDDPFYPEVGLAMAISKKALGTNKSGSNYYDEIKKWLPKKENESRVALSAMANDFMSFIGGTKDESKK